MSESREIDEDEFQEELELFETECELADLENSPSDDEMEPAVNQDRSGAAREERAHATPEDEILLLQLQRSLTEAEIHAANLRYQISVLQHRIESSKGINGPAAARFQGVPPAYGAFPGRPIVPGFPTPMAPMGVPDGMNPAAGFPPGANPVVYAAPPGAPAGFVPGVAGMPMADPNASRSGMMPYPPNAGGQVHGYPGAQFNPGYGYAGQGSQSFDRDNAQSKTRTVFIGNLDLGTRKEHLYQLFARCGVSAGDAQHDNIVRVTLRPDRNNANSQIAFVEFSTAQALNDAVALNGSLVVGRRANISPKRN